MDKHEIAVRDAVVGWAEYVSVEWRPARPWRRGEMVVIYRYRALGVKASDRFGGWTKARAARYAVSFFEAMCCPSLRGAGMGVRR